MTISIRPPYAWIKPASGLSVLLFILAVCSTGAYAQTPLPPDIDSPRRPKAAPAALTSEERDLARDYADLLESVQLLVGDFTGYFSELNLSSLAQVTEKLASMGDQITSGRLSANPQMLLDEVRGITANLTKIESQLGHTAEERKAHKLIRQLNQELGVTSDQLQNDLVGRFNRTSRNPQQISTYILDSLEEKLKQVEKSMALLEIQEKAKAEKYRIAVYPVAPGQPALPPVPEFPSFGGSEATAAPEGAPSTNKQTIAFSKDGIGSVIKEFCDSVKVPSPKTPITITNPAGDVVIIGWKRNMIQARAEMHFSVPSRKFAEQIATSANLVITPTPNGIQVNFDVPHFSDSRVSLNQNRVEVYVPNMNPVQLSAQFGMITASDLSGGTTINASNATINVSDISGVTTIHNSFGPTNITDLSGQIDITSTQAPIAITDCNAKMHIANSFATIELNDSRGDVTIQAAGQVTVRNHTGNINVTNQNGSVDLASIQGDVTTLNAFGPTTLRAITGAVSVENSNANIILQEIGGLLKVQNRFGAVSGQTLHGPLSIQSENGTVNLLLGRDFGGNSTINANFGSVQVIMPQESDVNLFARTTNGDIKTNLPLTMTSTGNEKTAVITVGAANKKLTVDGNGSVIFVSSTKR